jgi:hypothetical protein
MQSWLPYIAWICTARRIDAVLVAALIETESAGVSEMVHYESQRSPLVQPVQWAERLGIPVNTERMQQRTRWGLLQIPGTVARQRGCEVPYLTLLCHPAWNLEVGLRQIEWLLPQVYSQDDLIVAWRFGPPPPRSDGPMLVTYSAPAQAYLERVKALMVQLQGVPPSVPAD